MQFLNFISSRESSVLLALLTTARWSPRCSSFTLCEKPAVETGSSARMHVVRPRFPDGRLPDVSLQHRTCCGRTPGSYVGLVTWHNSLDVEAAFLNRKLPPIFLRFSNVLSLRNDAVRTCFVTCTPSRERYRKKSGISKLHPKSREFFVLLALLTTA